MEISQQTAILETPCFLTKKKPSSLGLLLGASTKEKKKKKLSGLFFVKWAIAKNASCRRVLVCILSAQTTDNSLTSSAQTSWQVGS